MDASLTIVDIRRLSLVQREMLLVHVAGGDQSVIKAGGPRGGAHQTAQTLIDRKCLQLIQGGRVTRLTERGRHAAAVILGEYADALVASGCLEPEARPLEILKRIKPLRPAPATPADLAALMAEERHPARD